MLVFGQTPNKIRHFISTRCYTAIRRWHIYHIEYQGSLLRGDHLVNTKYICGSFNTTNKVRKIFWHQEPRILLLQCPLDLDTLDTLDSQCVHVSRLCARCGGVRRLQRPGAARAQDSQDRCYRFSRAQALAQSTSPHTSTHYTSHTHHIVDDFI